MTHGGSVSLRHGYADLHTHTHFSDGLHSPREVIEFAARAELSWVAVTDHDSVEGLEEARGEAGRAGVGLVPGVELSVEFQGQDFHILGYWIDAADADLAALLSEVSNARIQRARRIVSRLHSVGVNLPFERVRAQARSRRYLGRPHVAHALISGGWVRTFREAFARYLGKDAPAYVPKDPLEPARALGILRKAGGVPVLAHPGAYRLDAVWDIFLREGLQGLETEHPKHSAEQAAGFRRLAGRHGLTMTGGSDFHGDGISDAAVGDTRVDASVLDQLAARKEQWI
jgi:predicted metal-dependent phosphoesterase TrpH